jgi:hypothetical protein
MRSAFFLFFDLLTTLNRTVQGFLSLFLRPRRLVRSAVIIRPYTLLACHNALKIRKYRLLHTNHGGRKPGTNGPAKELIRAIVGMKQRNPRQGCPRIAQQVNLAFGLNIDKDDVRRMGAILPGKNVNREWLLEQSTQ